RMAFFLDEGLGLVGSAGVQALVHFPELRRRLIPVVQRALQRAGDLRDGLAGDQVAADDDQRAVAAAGLEGGEFHGVSFAWCLLFAIREQNVLSFKQYFSLDLLDKLMNPTLRQ